MRSRRSRRYRSTRCASRSWRATRAPLSRAALGLADEWLFLSMFDHGSVLERKNPLGTIAAFTEAFSPSSGAVLILKSVNGEHDRFERDRVRAAAAPHPHVRLLEGYVSPAETHALIATADCFVSLHRAEGLGLGPAEAMALGKPVIATGYSGNLDYMTRENAYLVDYTLRSGRARLLALPGGCPVGRGRSRACRATDARGLRRSAFRARARCPGRGAARRDALAARRRAVDAPTAREHPRHARGRAVPADQGVRGRADARVSRAAAAAPGAWGVHPDRARVRAAVGRGRRAQVRPERGDPGDDAQHPGGDARGAAAPRTRGGRPAGRGRDGLSARGRLD